MPRVIPPSEDRDDEFFWEGVRQGKLLFKRCADCKTLIHPPVPMCGQCLSTEWDTQESTGRGTVYTWIVSRHPADPDDEPRIVALLDLEEGVRFVTNLVDCEIADVHNGMQVELTFVDYDTCRLPQFRPVGQARTGGGR